MSDNVIILGAGASSHAGIPMLGEFMDVMLRLARLGIWNGKQVSAEDRSILYDALEARDELDSYHGRVALDVWNLEDILSVLAFSNQGLLVKMSRAIARVIETTCTVEHDGNLELPCENPTLHGAFWQALIEWSQNKGLQVPTILTFNYDLVLERALLLQIHRMVRGEPSPFRYKAVHVEYATGACRTPVLGLEKWMWEHRHGQIPGIKATERRTIPHLAGSKDLKLEILKLHGSLNFQRQPADETNLRGNVDRLVKALPDPLILPPVFNKATNTLGKGIWDRALEVLRSCKNLIICGYSLPETDTYMQYFLKAALGPNKDLDRIFVFDPALFRMDRAEDGEALKGRYARNFSPPIQKRIEFTPVWSGVREDPTHGTLEHLVWCLRTHREQLLFG